ncbi:hypothetical protein HQ576_07740, partial [bacterium]|nr:hypothetical protein [bacterium]
MKRILSPAIALALLAAPARGAALQVTRELWGFDGKAVPERVNLLSLEIHNPDQQPFSGTLDLYRVDGMGSRRGARIVEPGFYLWAGARKWVQLLVYVGDEHEQWVLSWGLLARERAKLKAPAAGPPARVLLADPKNPFGGATGLRTFRSDLFPTTVIAMDGLHSLA